MPARVLSHRTEKLVINGEWLCLVIFGRRCDAHSKDRHFVIDSFKKYPLARDDVASQQLSNSCRVANGFG